MREQFIRLGQGFVLVYSVTDLGSFKGLNDYYEEIIDIKGTRDVPVVLVGNKCDLESSRKVTTEQGEELARKLNCPFLETSAKNGTHIEDVFAEIVREIDTHPPFEPVPTVPAEEKKKSKFLGFFKGK